jgi:hypothetical protein
MAELLPPSIDHERRDNQGFANFLDDVTKVFVVAVTGRKQALAKKEESLAEDCAERVKADTASSNSGSVMGGIGGGIGLS